MHLDYDVHFDAYEDITKLKKTRWWRDLPSKGASLFSSMGGITVDPKGVAKLLDGLNVHKASGPDGLNARVLKGCSNEISPNWHSSSMSL